MPIRAYSHRLADLLSDTDECEVEVSITPSSMIIELDFTPLDAEWTWTFMSLSESRKSKISYAPKTLDRINGALHMAYLLSRENSGSKNANTYFRSALCEFSSINDIAESEVGQEQPLLNTSHPLPHILKLLRNTQVHVSSFALDNSTMPLVLGMDGSIPAICSKWIIADISEKDLLRLDAFTKNKPHYTKEDATRMIEWLNLAQSQFGIPDLIRRAIEIFIDAYGNQDSLTI